MLLLNLRLDVLHLAHGSLTGDFKQRGPLRDRLEVSVLDVVFAGNISVLLCLLLVAIGVFPFTLSLVGLRLVVQTHAVEGLGDC